MKRVTLAAFLAAGVLLVGCGGGGGGDGGGNGNGNGNDNGNGGDKTALPTIQKAFPPFDYPHIKIGYVLAHIYDNATDFEASKDKMVEREINSGVSCRENSTHYFYCGDAYDYANDRDFYYIEGGDLVVTNTGRLPDELNITVGFSIGFEAFRYAFFYAPVEHDISSLDTVIGGYLSDYVVGKYYVDNSTMETAVKEYADKLKNEFGFISFTDERLNRTYYVKWDSKYYYGFHYVSSGGTILAQWEVAILDPVHKKLIDSGFYGLCSYYYVSCDYRK